jgi:porphobilinogen synthase
MNTMNLPVRPRRLRLHAPLRQAVRCVHLHPSQFILPVFVVEGTNQKRPVSSMPGVFQMSVDVALPWLATRAEEGFGAFLAFGVISKEKKDPLGSEALRGDNVVCRLLAETQRHKLPMTAMTDLCFCEYTDHGHCGSMTADRTTVDNDATVTRLVEQAIHHARAGAEVIAPSGMMDGTVGALRAGLDAAGLADVAILSYAVKYASAFYGPFRDAADSAPAFGDRASYQMDPAGDVRQALREAKLDVEQGADLIMVKPALSCLDIVSAVRQTVDVPVVAYQVSGEYAMLQAAAQNGWIDGDRALLESLISIKRAGADLMVTYAAERLAKLLPFA